ncbi:MAG: peptide ABC transporter substrate-binding protein [Gammaproteobacteria bacterium]|nr:peptide ABC transporter substrate-binding protein [Gammaproteobacteria bacterium]
MHYSNHSLSSFYFRFRQRSTFLLLLAGLILLPLSVQAEMVFRKGNGAEPGSLDPQIAEGVPASNILRDLYEGLTTEAADGAIIPGVAERWDVSEDGKTYLFHLREAKWSNGDPVTAGDFVYGWTRALNPATGSEYSFLLFPLENAQAIAGGEQEDLTALGVKAIDDKTLEVKLVGPAPYFLSMITHSIAMPVHRATVEAHGEQWTKPGNMVSNGPFTLAEWVPQSRIVLEKSSTYWDKEQVGLDKVIYYPTEDQNAELKRYRAGELDFTYEIPNDQIRWIRENLPDEFRVANYLGTYYYGFNTEQPPFKDNLELRKAFSMAIDRELLIEKIVTAGEVPAYAFVVPGVTAYDPVYVDFMELKGAAREEEIQRLYKEAGYSKDNPIEVEIRYNTNENHKKIAIAIASMWKKTFNAKVKLINEEWKVYLETRKQKQATQVFRAGWIGDYNDPYTFLELFLSDSGLNDVGFDSGEYDKLLAEASLASDADTRKQMLQQAERIFLDTHSLAPIYHYVSKRLVKPSVKGLVDNVMDHHRSKYVTIAE